MPSIVLLLGIGVLLGPDGFGVLDPEVFGRGGTEIVSLAVTVILFEGGLGLDLHRLGEQRRTFLLLLTVGGALSMAAGMLAAHLLLDMPWSTAALFGALMIVTGPTVVTPMMARLRVGRRVRELLIGEGVLIDPIGAIIALVLAEWVVGRSASVIESGWLAAWRMALGAATGALAGWGMAEAVRRRWVVGDLVSPAVLASALLVAALSSRLSAEAGLMSAVVQGVVLANARLPNLGRLREFKETLTLILLSFLFVMLAADVRLEDVRNLGWNALAVVAVLAWVARPIAMFLATRGSELTVG
jgi:NhaP-type Na+/H+ or K+/H+ antiporter